MKFLIIRFSSIGDIVLTTPVIRCLKNQVADAEVHYLTKNNFKEIVESNPFIDKIHLLNNNDFSTLIQNLKKENFHCIIDLHHNLRTLKIKRSLKKVPSFSFNKLNIEKWLFTALKINIMPDVHIVDRYLDTVKSFGVTNDGKGLDYFIAKKDIVPDHIPAAQSLGYVGIVIGAALNTKKLPLNKIKDLCNKINHPIILLGGPEDSAAGEEIASVDPIKIYNSCGKFNLNESAYLVRRAKLIITHDTGLMHIAAAFQKPVISIWGNTVPAFGMSPYYSNTMEKNALFEINGLWCRPCSKIGYNKCPLGHFKCMEKHDILKIVKTVEGTI